MWDNRPAALGVRLQASHNTDTKMHTQFDDITSSGGDITVLTLSKVNWELWIQPPVLFLNWLQSVLLGVLIGLSGLLHPLTTSVHLETPLRTLTADQIWGHI